MDDTNANAEGRLLPLLRDLFVRRVLNNFEGLFVFTVFVCIGFILYFVDHKLPFLNIYFIPILLAGYFLNTRSAVLGSLLATLVVTFFVMLEPEAFFQTPDRMSLYLHLLLWSSFLILTGALVGRMHEQLRERFAKARRTLEQLNELQEQLSQTNKKLEEKNLSLEITKARVESVLYASMDPLVARLIIQRKLRNEKRSVSVLFADLADFTSHLEDRPPEAVIEDLNRLYSSLEPVVMQYRGHLDKYLGDGLMAEFGVPFAARQHAALAVLAGLKMQERVVARKFPWKMRVGVASGPALVGLVGSENRRNYTAIGDTVNLASRLQEVCPLGGVCVDEGVFAEVGRWFLARRLRAGLAAEDARPLEAKLEALMGRVDRAPTPETCLEAAELCSELGDSETALKLQRRALELEPVRRKEVEFAIASAILMAEERGHLPIKGKRRRVLAYEILGLRDPLDDPRVPSAAQAVYRRHAAVSGLAEDALLPLEVLEGAPGHSRVVAALAAATADKMGLDEREQRTVFLAGMLHDAGKQGIPEHLLGYEDRLEELPPSEQKLLKDHVAQMDKVLAEGNLPNPPEVVEVVAQHHERFDGTGYPDGLKGPSIALGARIIAFADSYEMLTGWRPGQEPWEPRAALAAIRSQVEEGKLDPHIARVFLALMEG